MWSYYSGRMYKELRKKKIMGSVIEKFLLGMCELQIKSELFYLSY
jgi:hypothetical protein